MSSYLNSITIKNYKAFSEASIEIKPLTFFIGANSSGKSSILQLILALEQTINNKDSYSSALKLNGHYVNLGEDINVIKDKNKKNTLTIELGIDKDDFKNCFVDCFHSEFGNEIELFYKMYNKSLESNDDLQTSTVKLDYVKKYVEDKDYKKYVDNNKIYNKYFEDLTASLSNYIENYFRSVKSIHQLFSEDSGNDKIDISLLNDIIISYYNLLLQLKKSSNIKLCYKLSILPYRKTLSIVQCSIRTSENNEIGLSISQFENHIVNTMNDIIIPNQEIVKDDIYFDGLQPIYYTSFLNNTISSDKFVFAILKSAYKSLKQCFNRDKISYVGPLRAYPQRYYFLDESNSSDYFDAQSGQRLAEILKRNKDLEEKINGWLKSFEISISVNEFKDIIHKIKVNQNGLKLDITDVGFGYSQILPILVQGFMSDNNVMTIIEQPEIHLHPKMQASLADLFIDIVNTPSKNKRKQKALIIETHSEYMLKRLRRRIAERKLSQEDVAIYFVESRNKTNSESAKIRRVVVSDMGDIDWPEDFYITEYDDDMAFIKSKMDRKQ